MGVLGLGLKLAAGKGVKRTTLRKGVDIKQFISPKKGATKLAADVKANPDVFKQSKAFKEGLGKFGFNKPSGKK